MMRDRVGQLLIKCWNPTLAFFDGNTRALVSFSPWRRSMSTSLKVGVDLLHRGALMSMMQCYKKLSKAKLSAFVVASAGAGFVLASKESVDGCKLGWTMLGTFGAAASANTFNQIMEWKKDAMMSRTRLRPLPSGQITRTHALIFAILTGFSGISILSHQTNEVAAGLAAGNIVLYAGIYTPLKQITYLNTWIGAIVGAIPPLLGWSAATGGKLDPGAWIMASLLYFWQIPHFLALAWTYRVDYANAGFQMLSKFDLTGKKTAKCAFRNCLYLLPLGILSCHFQVTDRWFIYESTILTLFMALSAAAFHQNASKQNSRSLFKATILYLPLILSAMMFHRQSKSNEVSYSWKDMSRELQHLLWQLRCHETSIKSIENKDFEETEIKNVACQAMKGSIDLYGSYAPFPFVPVPKTVGQNFCLWDGLDEAISEVSGENSPDVA